MNIIVTGAEGFLGRQVVARLVAAGHPVIAVDRIAHEGEAQPGVVYHQNDLSDPATLHPCPVVPASPFTLVHLAWDMRRHVGFVEQAEQVRLFAALLDHWTGKGLQRMVGMGSAEEYGSREGMLCETDSPEGLLSPYGWAKCAAGGLVRSWSARAGIPVWWLRPFIIYGPGQKGDMMIPYAMTCAREGREAEFTDGLQRRDFVHVGDVADAIVCAVQAEAAGFRVCNLGRGEPVAVRDVLMAIADGCGVRSLFHLGARPRRSGEPDVQVADTTEAREQLGWSAKIDWRDGIEEMVR
jgi:nucleoside-diphosphate-sugar epimerase